MFLVQAQCQRQGSEFGTSASNVQGREDFKDDKHTGRPRSARSAPKIRQVENALTQN